MEEIRQSELRNDNARVMRRVATGEAFVVTVRGRPVADLVPHRADDPRRVFISVGEVAAAFADAPIVDPAAWRADVRGAADDLGSDLPTDPFARHGA